jgi:LEA14-like dessication related protein
MKHSSHKIPAVILTLVFVLPGCTFTKLMTSRIAKPTFTYIGTEVVEVSQSKAVVNFLFSAHNPNNAGLKNIACSYELFVEGKNFASGNDVLLELAPNGDRTIKIPATIAYAGLFPVLGSVLRQIVSGQKTILITIDAVFSGRPAIYTEAGREEPISFEVKLTKTVNVPLPQAIRNTGP